MTCRVEQDLNRYLEKQVRQDEEGEIREVLRSEAENNCLYDDEAASERYYCDLLDDGLEAAIKTFIKGMRATYDTEEYAVLAEALEGFIVKALEDGTNIEDEIDKLVNR